MTDNQRRLLLACLDASLRDGWYRAKTSGERVTLASLYYKGFVIRRAWRTSKSSANNAYEYRASDAIIREWKRKWKREETTHGG